MDEAEATGGDHRPAERLKPVVVSAVVPLADGGGGGRVDDQVGEIELAEVLLRNDVMGVEVPLARVVIVVGGGDAASVEGEDDPLEPLGRLALLAGAALRLPRSLRPGVRRGQVACHTFD